MKTPVKKKRETVARMLKNRLSSSKQGLSYQSTYAHLTDVLGGPWDEEIEKQFEINMRKDIDQLEYLLWCLNNEELINQFNLTKKISNN